MSVYRPKGCHTYIYDFRFRGERYKDSTHQHTIENARAVETEVRARLRRQAGGILRAKDTPRFSEWAGVFYRYCVNDLELAAPQHVMDSLRVVLRFWGTRPTSTAIEPDAPYHDLHLADPIDDPDWITKFDDWIKTRRGGRGVSNQQRNHYMSCLSRMYRCALEPKFRKHAGVNFNPFAGVPRRRTRSRQVVLDLDQIRAWITAASYHVRLAVAIAALAPKLRIANILALRWDTNLDPTLTRIEVADHKTANSSGLPMVAPISAQLRAILEDARQRRPDATHVVTYRGVPVRQIRGGVENALTRAGIPYGRDVKGGATFHTLRHSMATLLADLDEAEAKRAALMGQDPATTAKYTHLRAVGQRESAERLSQAVPIADVVTQPHLRAAGAASEGRRVGGKIRGPLSVRGLKTADSQGISRSRRKA